MRKEAYTNVGAHLPTEPSASNYDLTVWDQNRYTDWQEVFGGGSGKFSFCCRRHFRRNANHSIFVGSYQSQVSLFAGKKRDQLGSGHFSIIGNSPNRKMRVSLNGSYSGNSSKLSWFYDGGFEICTECLMPFMEADGALNWEPNPLRLDFATLTKSLCKTCRRQQNPIQTYLRPALIFRMS